MHRVEHPDTAIDRLAAVQHGVMTRSQVTQAGVSRRSIDRRLATGRLERLFHGVYRVGPIRSPRAREMAALTWDDVTGRSEATVAVLARALAQHP